MPTRPAKNRKRLYGRPPSSKREKGKYIRPNSSPEYHTWRWTKESRAFRETNPLCEECKRNGYIVESEVVDHIIPFPVCKDFFDQTNWQALCKKCNITKGNRDKKLIQNYKQNE